MFANSGRGDLLLKIYVSGQSESSLLQQTNKRHKAFKICLFTLLRIYHNLPDELELKAFNVVVFPAMPHIAQCTCSIQWQPDILPSNK